MAGLTTIFKNEGGELQEQDKLVDLFRSRAELKKEFAALRNEKYRLQDRIKQQAGANARVEQRLEHIENLLSDPDWVFDVVVFYQLRGLLGQCEAKLKDFAEQLKQHQEKRLHGQAMATWSKQRQEKIDAIEREVAEYRVQMEHLKEELKARSARVTEMGGIAKLVRGNAANREIESLSNRVDAGQQREQELLQALHSLEKLEPPTRCSLDAATKRSINIQVLAFAQQLYLQFSDDNLLQLAKEAIEKSVGAIKYGDRSACERILACLDKCRNESWLSEDFAEILKNRCQLLAQSAEYRDDGDTIPIPASVTTVFAIDKDGEVTRTTADFIGENIFGIVRILSR